MATIQKIENHGRVKYRVDYGIVAGRRRRKFFDSFAEARHAAARHEKERREIGNAWIELPARERHATLTVLEDMKAHGTTVAEVWAEAKARQAARVGLTVNAAIDRFLKEKEASGLRPLYIKSLRLTLKKIREEFGERDVAEIGQEELRRNLFAVSPKLSTVQSVKTRYGSFFSWALRSGLTKENPVTKIESPKWEHPEPEILTVEQCRALVDATREDKPFRKYLALALFLGIRPEECRRLDAKAIDLERGIVTVSGAAAKTRDRRIIEINAPARRLLEKARGDWQESYKHRLKRLFTRAGMKTWPRDVLRHTAASHFYNIHGIDRATEQLGHSAGVMLKHYRSLVTREDSEAWLEIGA